MKFYVSQYYEAFSRLYLCIKSRSTAIYKYLGPMWVKGKYGICAATGKQNLFECLYTVALL